MEIDITHNQPITLTFTTDHIGHNDTEAIFADSGAFEYPWYSVVAIGIQGAAHWFRVVTDPRVPWRDEPHTSIRIDHDVIMGAIKKILENTESVKVHKRTYDQCVALVTNRDDVDFDTVAADQVIQVGAFGSVVFE